MVMVELEQVFLCAGHLLIKHSSREAIHFTQLISALLNKSFQVSKTP